MNTMLPKTRALGLLAGLEIAGDAARFTRLSKALEAKRVYTHPNARIRTLIIAPPLVITESEMLRGLRAIEDAIVESV